MGSLHIIHARVLGSMKYSRCLPYNSRSHARTHAGWTLRNLAVNAENKVLIVEEGGLVPLIALLHSMNERAQEHAAGALRSLSVNAENQNLIVQNLGLPPLVALLHSQNAAVQEQAVVCIRNLSVNDENEVKIVQEGALPPLIKLLQSPVERIQVCFHTYMCVCVCVCVDAYVYLCVRLYQKKHRLQIDCPAEVSLSGSAVHCIFYMHAYIFHV
jgi:hypothetical protein